jgi:hypothetical protein
MLDQAKKFFIACRAPILNKSAALLSTSNFRDELQIVKYKISQNSNIEAYMVPNSIRKWPSFLAPKQDDSANPHIFYHRVSKSQQIRFNAVIELLKKGRKVVSTGLSGIGKSSDMNYFLLYFLSQMKENSWPTMILYRIGKILFKFSLSNDDKEIVSLEKRVDLDRLSEITNEFYHLPKSSQPVLLIEMLENEINPVSYIPALIQPSNRNVIEMTKEFHKSSAKYLLINPPTQKEVIDMAILDGKAFESNSVFANQDKNSIRRMVKERFDVFGPVVRFLFLQESDFKAQVAHLEKGISLLFTDIKHLSVDNVPSGAKRYLGPYLNDENALPDFFINSNLQFLSTHIKYLIANYIYSVEQRAILLNHGYLFQIQEAIVQYGLQQRDLEITPSWDVSKWEMFRNYSTKTKKVSYEDLGIVRYHKIVHFDSTVLKRPVTELEDNALYISTKHNAILMDMMIVNKAKRTVCAFQVSSLNPNEHSLSTATIEKVFNGLCLGENGFKMKYIYCYDSSIPYEMRFAKQRDDSLAVKNFEFIHAIIRFFPNLQSTVS